MLILSLFIHFSCVVKFFPEVKIGWISFENIIPSKSSFKKFGFRKNAPIKSH
jgi:hypothetical protein